MKQFIYGLVNSLWFISSLAEAQAYFRGQNQVEATQRAYLLNHLKTQADTGFGRRYQLKTIHSVAEYQDRVPLTTYDDYQLDIEKIGQGKSQVLTQQPIQLLEPTSGSTAATKYIPYTAQLKSEFQRAIAPWMVNTFWHHPQLMPGQAYWSISPVMQQDQRTPGGIPIGFDDDAEYLGGIQSRLVQTLMAVPSQVRFINDITTFRYITLLFLLRSRHLSLISVWNPTFLTLLLAPLKDWWPQLTIDIARGTLTPPGTLPAQIQSQLTALNKPNARRADEIQAAFAAHQADSDPLSLPTAAIWPSLRLISCWADAQAARHIPEIRRLFPAVTIQPKGLLATEGFVSFPLASLSHSKRFNPSRQKNDPPIYPGAALAYRSHFFEFLPDQEPISTPKLAHQLRQGEQYQVILTTGGGLYRYQLQDVVTVTGHMGKIPLLRFEGKTGYISDHFGEKLNERHVRDVLDTTLNQSQLTVTFMFLACETNRLPATYTLFIESDTASQADLQMLANSVEDQLQANFHYQQCRQLGQLNAIRVFRIHKNGQQAYIATCQRRGQRLGDIKMMALDRESGWSDVFDGVWV
ncbi:MAG: GH3 auxin-responsive promoter family protein [Chloroflexota bacterium]